MLRKLPLSGVQDFTKIRNDFDECGKFYGREGKTLELLDGSLKNVVEWKTA
jgi:hypothetical protein